MTAISYTDPTATPISRAELATLTVNVLRVSMPAGSRGDFVHDVPVLLENEDGSSVTSHDYGYPDGHLEIHCNCAAWSFERPCAHALAVQAKREALSLEPATA